MRRSNAKTNARSFRPSESGLIEQDSDVVMFIYRREYYLSREQPERKPSEDDGRFNDRYQQWQKDLEDCANTADIIIAKQRHGPIGTVQLSLIPTSRALVIWNGVMADRLARG